jgi:hypothetical protein
MAAPTNEVVGVNLLLKANSTLIGGQTGLDLEKSFNLQEVNDKSAGFFGKSIPGFAESSITADNAYTGTGGDHLLGENDNVKVTLQDQGGTSTETVKGLQEMSCTLESDLTEVQTFQTTDAKEYRVTGQSLDLSLTAQYFDPNSSSGSGHEKIFKAEENDEYLTLTLTFGALSITGDIRPTDWTLSAPADNETATFEPTFRHEGVISHSGSVDGGLDAFVDAWFNRNTVSALLEYNTGSAVTGATSFDGSAYVSSLELSGTQGEPLDLNADLQIDGGLTRSTQ